MNLHRHIAAIIRRNPNQADYCAERIVKLVEKNFTANNNARVEICPDCDNDVLAEGSMMERPCPKCGGTGKLSPVA